MRVEFGQATPRVGMGVAVISVAAAVLLRFALAPLLGSETPFILFFAAVLASASIGGLRPGLVATALSALSAAFFFFEPKYTLVISAPRQFVQLLLFLLEGGAISYISGALCTAHSASRAAAERLRVTLRGIGDGVVVTDVEGHVTIMNAVAEQLTGWPEDDARGQLLEQVFQIVNEHTRVAVDNPVRRVLREGRIQGLANHTVLVARDGTERPIDDSAAPIRDRRGALLGVVMVFRDVTTRRRAEMQREELLRLAQEARAEAEEASRAKDNFIAVLSHELRSPLAAMSGWLQVLRRTMNDEVTRGRGLATLERNVALQTELIDDLLDVSRIVSGKLHLELAPVDFTALVKECLDAHEPSMAAKSVTLTRYIDDERLIVRGDGKRLAQVITNLLNNAAKFTSEKGTVEVRLQRQEGTAVLTVRDTGVGIAPEFLPHVFTRFAQDSGATMRRYGGLGIGLSIVSEVVRRHGGTVHAASDGLGKGAAFSVRLPLAEAQRERVTIGTAPASTGAASGATIRVRVLLVEDDADTREALKIWLDGEGLRVSEAGSLPEALASYEREPVDLVISDIGLPGGDGYALIRAIRERDERDGRPPVLAIALSGFATGSDHEQALRAGFDEHVTKPVDLTTLLEQITVLLASRRLGS